MTKIVVVLGQTASGKSSLAVWLAKKINGEVISADSRQVYRGINIGSGKITKKEMSGVPHYLLDVASPKKIFTASRFVNLAKKAISKISRKGKVPIVCGGTGFYIDALMSDITIPDVPPNLRLRKRLAKLDNDVLMLKLKKLDQRRSETIDPKNKVRVIRAIEIALAQGEAPKTKQSAEYRAIKIGLRLKDRALRENIEARLNKRLKSGLIGEVRKLQSQGVSWKRLYDLGLECRYVSFYLQKVLSKKEMVDILKHKIWQYSKRQMTWFKRHKEIIWFAPKEKKKILPAVKKFLKH